jgi:2-haloacid dehalogenase
MDFINLSHGSFYMIGAYFCGTVVAFTGSILLGVLIGLVGVFIVCTLSNGNIGLLTDMAKQAGLPWDCILCAENFNKYKPHPDTYRGVVTTFAAEPGQVMLAAAHHSDLEHARNCGLKTAYIERPFEYGCDNPKPVVPWDVNTLHTTSIVILAEQMGC